MISENIETLKEWLLLPTESSSFSFFKKNVIEIVEFKDEYLYDNLFLKVQKIQYSVGVKVCSKSIYTFVFSHSSPTTIINFWSTKTFLKVNLE